MIASPGTAATVRGRAVVRAPRPDSLPAIAVVTGLLALATVPTALAEGLFSVVVAVLLSIAAGLSLRHPLPACALIAAVLLATLGHAPGHLGLSILASPIAVASAAAHGRVLLGTLAAGAHLAIDCTSLLLTDLPGADVVTMLSAGLLVEIAAVLGGAWVRQLVRQAGHERARRLTDLAEQRRAIARELHDAGARAMTRVALLADERTRLDPLDPDDALALRRISETAREGAAQMRILLDALRLEAEHGGEGEDDWAGTVCGLGDDTARAEVTTTGTAGGPTAGELLESMRLQLVSDGFCAEVSNEVRRGGRGLPLDLLRRCLDEIEENIRRHGDRGAPVAVLLDLHEDDGPALRGAAVGAAVGAGTGAGAGAGAVLELAVLNGIAEDPLLRLRGPVPPHGADGADAPRRSRWGLVGLSERLAPVGGGLVADGDGRTFLTRVSIPVAVGPAVSAASSSAASISAASSSAAPAPAEAR
ncbi:hypothetical protein ACXET9_10620 [Brachybacterium sp. DNPG3]